MNWFVWRQYKRTFLLTGLVVVAYATLLVLLGHHSAVLYDRALSKHQLQHFSTSATPVMLCLASVIVPVLFGAFWGAPLIAKEYSENTAKLVWTQSVTRRKWLFAKLGGVMVFAGLYGGIISAAVTLSLRTDNALHYNRFEPIQFSTQGLIPVACSMFAVALGACVGAWRRQVLSALAITGIICMVTMFGLSRYVRSHYMTPVTTGGDFFSSVASPTEYAVPKYGTAWVVKRTYKDFSGSCQVFQGNKVCSYSQVVDKTTYQPASRYWLFQGIETSIYLGLSALLAIGTYRLISRRDV